MSLRSLVKSMDRREVLLPRLYRFLAEEDDALKKGFKSHKQVVLKDAEMTVEAFKERIEEFNHGALEGELFHPSQLGGCLRSAWFDLKGAPKNKGKETGADFFRTHMVFETGTYVGVMFANLVDRAGYLHAREVPIISQEHKTLGHADGEIDLKDGRGIGVLEVKTINPNQFSKLKDEPKEGHKKQIMAYMKPLKRTWGSIVYLEKARHEAKEYVVKFDEDYYNKHVRDRIDTFFTSLKTNVPPPHEGSGPTVAPCRWCPYTRVCFGTLEYAAFMKQLRNGKKKKLKFVKWQNS